MFFSFWSFEALPKQMPSHHIILNIQLIMEINIRINDLWTLKLKMSILTAVQTHMKD